MSEPLITINGKLLNEAQAMSLRVAATSYFQDTKNETYLGDDEGGKRMTKLYNQRISEVLVLMHDPK